MSRQRPKFEITPKRWQSFFFGGMRTFSSILFGRSYILRFVVIGALLCSGSLIRARTYMRYSKDGVVHFTNIKPKGKKRRQWRTFKSDPSRVSHVSVVGKGRDEGRSFNKNRPVRLLHRADIKKNAPSGMAHGYRRRKYKDLIDKAAFYYGLPTAFVRAVVEIESNYNPVAVSSANALGLMQLLPATARAMGISEFFDPMQNIFAGSRYLRLMANRFKGDIRKTIAAYHAGPGAVIRHNGIPPYESTQLYVRMVMKRFKILSAAGL